MAPAHGVALRDVTLDDKYALESGRVFLTGSQALVRLLILQRQRDALAGLNTAGFVSGYRGSPPRKPSTRVAADKEEPEPEWICEEEDDYQGEQDQTADEAALGGSTARRGGRREARRNRRRRRSAARPGAPWSRANRCRTGRALRS